MATNEIVLCGGTESDRVEILRLHDDYIDANTRYDWEKLRPIFSPSDRATFFNLNGFTYAGRDQWIRLWKYYATQVSSTHWTPYDFGGEIGATIAVVWCQRTSRRSWVGADKPVKDFNYDDKSFMTRSTMVFHKEGDAWRVVHAHFSKGEEGARPGGV